MLFTIVIFFIVLGILVLVHEWGHFVTARKAGMKVDEFGFGLPPRIIGFYKAEDGRWQRVGLKTKETSRTIWSLNWLPLGCFVRIKGEQGEAAGDSDSFAGKNVWQRIIVISAGVTMNLILAVVLLSIGFALGVPQIVDDEQSLPASVKVRDQKIQIIEVLANSPAAEAGLEVADVITAVDDKTLTKVSQLQDYLAQKADTSVSLSLERKKEPLLIAVTPTVLAETNQVGVGVGLIQTAIVSYPWYTAGWHGLTETLRMIWTIIFSFFLIIQSLIVSHELIGEVYGPIGIATLVGDAARLGFLYILQLTATLSVIIAVINFLPFPALDGGRAFFLFIEALRGKPINAKVENLMHNVGFILLLLLLLLVTLKDISRLSAGLFGWLG